MTPQQAIQLALDCANMIVKMYLEDLTEAELFVRAVPGSNHIAWQLGHLIESERMFVDMFCPGASPALPAGFAEKHASDKAASDSPADFLKKAEYLALYEKQRAATIKALHSLSASDLDKPVPEKFQGYMKSVGDGFSLQGTHWVMHAGQWALIRRKLGRKPLF